MRTIIEVSDEELQLILKFRAEKELTKAWKPVSANEYTPQEKEAAFNQLHKMALDHYNYLVKNGYTRNDGDHYIFEAVMELLGKGIWCAVRNAILR
jgi:hypothetical protein